MLLLPVHKRFCCLISKLNVVSRIPTLRNSLIVYSSEFLLRQGSFPEKEDITAAYETQKHKNRVEMGVRLK